MRTRIRDTPAPRVAPKQRSTRSSRMPSSSAHRSSSVPRTASSTSLPIWRASHLSCR
jgi:hypothetical protein